MKCIKCGAEITQTAKYCLQCGGLQTKCQACGFTLPEFAQFCSHCGAVQTAPRFIPPIYTDTTRVPNLYGGSLNHSNKLFIIIGIAAAVVVVILIMIVRTAGSSPQRKELQSCLQNVCINLGGSESECSDPARLREIEQKLPGVCAGYHSNDNKVIQDETSRQMSTYNATPVQPTPETRTASGVRDAVTLFNVSPISLTPSSTQDPTESKRLNTEGLHSLSGANPDFASAREDFERSFQLDSTNVEALNNLGYVYGRLGDYQTAESILLKVLDMSPTRKAALGNLGAIQAELGETQEAADHFCQYIRHFDSLEQGKSTLSRVFKDADSQVKTAIDLTLANCN